MKWEILRYGFGKVILNIFGVSLIVNLVRV